MSAAGLRRPSFAAGFPRDARLDEAVKLFDRGDYKACRALATAILDNKKEPRSPYREPMDGAPEEASLEVRAAARELLRRMDPDPLVKVLVALAAGLLALVAGYYWTHPLSHDRPQSAPSRPAASPGEGPTNAR